MEPPNKGHFGDTVEPPNKGHVGDTVEPLNKGYFGDTVEPPSKGHFGANSFVPCREVVPISEGPLSEVPQYSFFNFSFLVCPFHLHFHLVSYSYLR